MQEVIRSDMPWDAKHMLARHLEIIFKSVQVGLGRYYRMRIHEGRLREIKDIGMELQAFRGSLTRIDYEHKRMIELRRLQGVLDSMTRQLDEKTVQYRGQQAHVDMLRKEYVEKSQVPPYGDPVLHAQHMSALAVAKGLFAQGKALYEQRKKVEATFIEVFRE